MDHGSEPTLSPKLIEKLRSADLGAIADLFIEARTGIRKVDAREANELPIIVEYEDDAPKPVYPVEAVAKESDFLYLIDVRSRSMIGRPAYRFFATEDWRHLAVPMQLLPPECLPDPVIKDYHWWRGTGADTICSPETARKVAERIVREFDGLDYDESNPDSLNITFNVKTPKKTHTYMTRHGWRGLWCPIYMAPEDVKPDSWKYHFVRILGEKEIEGKKEVTKYARKHAKDFDQLITKPPKRRRKETPYRAYYIPIERQRKLWEVQEFLEAKNPNGCSESEALRACIDAMHATLPPRSEWVYVKHPLRRKKKK